MDGTTTASRLTRRYLVALCLVATATVLFFLLLAMDLKRRQYDARIINIAGRHRMLNQLICKESLSISQVAEGPELTARLDALNQAIGRWRYYHQDLSGGDPGVGLPTRNSGEIDRLFRELEPSYQAMSAAALDLVAAGRRSPPDRAAIDADLRIILDHEGEVLRLADNVIAQYEKEALDGLADLQRHEIGIAGLVLVVLALVGLLILRPAVRDVRRTIGQLVTSEAELRHSSGELEAVVASLGQSERRFRGAFDAAAFGMALLSPDGRFLRVNRALREIVGYSEAELLRLDFQAITHAEDLEADLDSCRRLLAGETDSYQMEKRYIHKRGHLVWIVLSVTLVRDSSGGPLHFVAMIEDVTPRKRAEAALIEATALRDAILASANFSIIATDTEGRVLIFNEAAEHWLGYQAEEVVGRLSPGVFHVEAEVARRAAELSAELGRPIAPGFEVFVARARLDQCDERDWTYVRKDGSRFPVRLSITSLRGPGGEISGFVGIASDQTDRQRAEEERGRLIAILEATTDFVGMADVDHRVVYLNRAFRAAAGLGDAPLHGLRIPDLHPDWCNRLMVEEGLPTALTDGIWSGEGGVLSGGRDLHCSQVILSHRDADGVPRHVSTVMRDISDQKRLTESFKLAKESAETSTRAKSEFLANMSHEIRTPMNGILGMTELLMATALSTRQREYLGMVKQSAESLLQVINDILDFSKVEAGKLEIVPIPFGLREGLTSTLRTLSYRAHGKGLELACRIAPDIPDALVGDAGRLRQIVVNLVGNAIKFTHEGEIVVTVEAERPGPDSVVLHVAVADTGIGIPEEKRRAIFAPFEQADGSTTRQYGGTGLGLSISARLVEMMGGRIWVDPNPAGGSIFRFTLDLALSDEPESARFVPNPHVLAGRRLLVVDDNHTNRLILQEMLRQWGARVVVAAGAREALNALEAAARDGQPFEAALLDELMPEIDGLELARMIRSEPGHDGLGLLVLTSSNRPADQAREASWRIGDRLTKPVSPADLLAALARLLGLEPASAAAAAGPFPSLAPSARLRVLLAEDHPINQVVAKGMLEKLGHAVAVVGDGKAAVAALADSPAGYDLVLMDLQMPVMDGFEAVAAIRSMDSIASRARIVALTAHAIEGDRQRCLGSGFDEYLSKPIDPALLAEALARFAAESQAAAGPAPPRAPDPAGFDRSRALEHLAGNEQLLADVLAMFFEDWPRLSRSLREAIDGHDAAALRRHGHSAAGLADSLAVPAVAAAGRRLEGMGRAGVLDGAEGAFADLERAVDRFRDVVVEGATTC